MFLSQKKPEKIYSFLAQLEKFDQLPVMVYVATNSGSIYIKYDASKTDASEKQIMTEVKRIIRS